MPQTFQKKGGPVIVTVRIRVLQDFDSPILQGRYLLLPAAAIGGLLPWCKGVVSHLHHPHSPLRIPIHKDGILHQWLMGHQTDCVAWFHAQGFERVLGRQRRRPWHAQQLGQRHQHSTRCISQSPFFKSHPGVFTLRIHKQWQAAGIASTTFTQHLCPTLFPLHIGLCYVIEKINAITFGIRDEQVLMPVPIQIHKKQTPLFSRLRQWRDLYRRLRRQPTPCRGKHQAAA